ncbi:helix-turn-helix domain-containing protein [Anaeropeptidivorans aminofermentans]|uniref:helix-turn-helix domain-containing protein n=1 Tax=Anaeropeptidivorans aminofermentans TaxID=2934315 RepID=UPI0020242350|nr:helix-turn-helix transcriptional regulator [Anaeropeptidivorans aminofermentans]
MIRTRLIHLRESRNLKQKDAAEALNIPTRTYGNYEMGTRSIPLDILIEIAKFYNTSTDYISKITNKKEAYPSE